MDKEYLKYCDICKSDKFRPIDSLGEMMKCTNCHFIFQNPRPRINIITKHYTSSGKYDGWLQNLNGRKKMWGKRLKKIRKIRDSGSLLDIGSGIGQFLFLCKNYYDVLGTEISNEAVRIAKKKYEVQLFEGTIKEIKFDKKVDIITIFHVLEHVTSPSEEINTCNNLLKDDGLIFIAVPNAYMTPFKFFLIKLLNAIGLKKFKTTSMFHKIDSANGNLDEELHFSFFTNKTIRKLLVDKSFFIIDDSLDPYYPSIGTRRILDSIVYHFMSAINTITGLNFYRTIWIAARKTDHAY